MAIKLTKKNNYLIIFIIMQIKLFLQIIYLKMKKVIEENIRATKVMSPDYVNVPPDEVVKGYPLLHSHSFYIN